MFRVQFRDAGKPDKILVNTMFLPFDPRDQKEIRLRRRAKDDKHVSYRVIDHIYEIVEDNPGESGIVLLVSQI
jgi:hypothetical protein